MNVAITRGRVNGVASEARESDWSQPRGTNLLRSALAARSADATGSAEATGSADATVLAQEFFAVFGHFHDQPETGNGFARDVAAIDRILPDRQPRAGRPPGRDNVRIDPRLPCDPFDKIEHQWIRRLGHRAFSCCQKEAAELRASSSQLP